MTLLPLARLTASTSIRPIAWRAATPTRYCLLTSCAAPASRSSSSTARSACRPRTTCCCRCRAWWRSMSVRRSWSAAAAASGTGPGRVRSTCSRGRRMATATWASTTAAGSRATMSSRSRRAWCGKSSNGSDATAPASARCAGACTGRAARPAAARRPGTGRRCGPCSGTRPTRARPPLARRASDLCPTGCGRCAAAASSRVAPTGCMTRLRRTGSASPCRGWSTRRCSTPFASNSPRTAAGAGRAPEARATSCKAFWCATLAATPTTARRSACALRKASGATTPTTGAAAPTPTASAASAYARTVRSAPTGWTRRSGARSSGCCTTRPGLPRNTSGASTRHSVGEATALTSPRPRRSLASCAGAWAG